MSKVRKKFPFCEYYLVFLACQIQNIACWGFISFALITASITAILRGRVGETAYSNKKKETGVRCLANQEVISQIRSSVASSGHVTLSAEPTWCPLCVFVSEFLWMSCLQMFTHVIDAGGMWTLWQRNRDVCFVSWSFILVKPSLCCFPRAAHVHFSPGGEKVANIAFF